MLEKSKLILFSLLIFSATFLPVLVSTLPYLKEELSNPKNPIVLEAERESFKLPPLKVRSRLSLDVGKFAVQFTQKNNIYTLKSLWHPNAQTQYDKLPIELKNTNITDLNINNTFTLHMLFKSSDFTDGDLFGWGDCDHNRFVTHSTQQKILIFLLGTYKFNSVEIPFESLTTKALSIRRDGDHLTVLLNNEGVHLKNYKNFVTTQVSDLQIGSSPCGSQLNGQIFYFLLSPTAEPLENFFLKHQVLSTQHLGENKK